MQGHDGRADGRQAIEIPGRGLGRIDQHILPRQGVERAFQRRGGLDRYGVAQPAGQFVGDLARVEEQLRRAVRIHHRLTQRQGRADHIAAANVEEPCQRRRRSQNGGVGAGLGDGLADAGAFGRAALAGIAVLMRHDGRGRLARPLVGPGHVQRVGLDGLQFGSGLGRRALQARQGIGAVQTRVVADNRPLGRALQIAGDAAVLEFENFELVRIDLGPDLHRVTAVSKDGGAVFHDHTRPGRAGEAAQPRQPVVGGGQIFVLVLVLMRDQQAVEALLGHLRADEGKVFRPEGRIGGFVKGLAHGGRIASPSPSWGGWSRSERVGNV